MFDVLYTQNFNKSIHTVLRPVKCIIKSNLNSWYLRQTKIKWNSSSTHKRQIVYIRCNNSMFLLRLVSTANEWEESLTFELLNWLRKCHALYVVQLIQSTFFHDIDIHWIKKLLNIVKSIWLYLCTSVGLCINTEQYLDRLLS